MNKTKEIMINEVLENLTRLIDKNPDLTWSNLLLNGGAFGGAINPITPTQYKGINALNLSIISALQGYTSNLWLTFNQLKANNMSLTNAKGCGAMVVYSSIKESKKIDPKTGKPEKYFLLKYTKVFNFDHVKECAQKIKYVEKFRPPTNNKIQTISKIERDVSLYFDRSGVNFDHSEGTPFYSSTRDIIRIPNIDRYSTAAGYYEAKLHELIHSTGHTTRLNRKLSNSFGTSAYAFEELIAEIGTAFLFSRYGLETSDTNQNMAAYVKSWLTALKDNKELIYKAAKDSHKAVEYYQEQIA